MSSPVPWLTMRRLTAAVVIVGCAFALARGWGIVRLTEAQAAVASHPGTDGTLQAWTQSLGLSTTALEAGLSQEEAPGPGQLAAQRRATELAAYLAIRPLSPRAWLLLAMTRFAAGQSRQRVLAALTLSWLTGPNEGSVMWRRGLFALTQWQRLPPDARARTVADLAGAISAGATEDLSLGVARSILDGMRPPAQQHIAEMLWARGLSAAQLAAIGLVNKAPRGP